jgi:hypothetical protein
MDLKTDPELRSATEKLWAFMRMDHDVDRDDIHADVIFALGSNDLRVADRAAELFLAGRGKYLVVSGGFGNLTRVWAALQVVRLPYPLLCLNRVCFSSLRGICLQSEHGPWAYPPIASS